MQQSMEVVGDIHQIYTINMEMQHTKQEDGMTLMIMLPLHTRTTLSSTVELTMATLAALDISQP